MRTAVFTPTYPLEVRTAAQEYLVLHGTECSLDLRQILLVAMSYPSPVDFCVNFCEIVYACPECPSELRELAAGAADLCAQMGWHGMEQRGAQLAAALRGGAAGPAPLEKYVSAFSVEEG